MLLKVEFDNRVRVAGETLAGVVLLNFKELQRDPLEEVYVRIAGYVSTSVKIGKHTSREKVEILNDRRTLWKAHTVYPPPDTHILKLPFSLALPPSSLPSCQYDSVHGHCCAVIYSLEVIGQRTGLRPNESHVSTIRVLLADPNGARLYDSLQRQWAGPMCERTHQKMIRKGVWGEYSKVVLRLSMPNITSYPVSAFIPFSLNIETMTKRMRLADTPKSGAIFPTPPRHSREIEIVLKTQITIRAEGHGASWHQTKPLPCSQYGNIRAVEPPRTDKSIHGTIAHVPGREWIAVRGHDMEGEDKAQVGSWRQHVVYQSKFLLDCPPTFKSKNVDVSHELEWKVPFPGLGNDMTYKIPIVVVSSKDIPS